MSSSHLNSMNSVHDFHRFAIHHNGVSPVLHFHLAGSINPETGKLLVQVRMGTLAGKEMESG